MIAWMVPGTWSWVLPWLLLVPIQLAIAIAVTAHVLFHKSDVRAALGWIGVAWLAPLAGGVLYYLFGINRVTRRALHFGRTEPEYEEPAGEVAGLALPANIETLAAVSLRVTGTALTTGNSVSLLHGGDEAYPQMLAAIRGARESVALTAYIFRDDAAGASIVDALIEAHGRGIAVRVLLDAVGSGYIRRPVFRRLRAGEVPVARFLHTWVPWRMPFLNMRNHKKLLIIDGCVAFTGGLNIGVENCARLEPSHRVDDVHVRVEGPIVGQMMENFAQDWSFSTDEALEQDMWWPELRPAGGVLARSIRSGPDADIDKLETILGAALTQARRRVRIVTPYFLPDQKLQFAIAQAQLRGAAVDILIPEVSDLAFMDWAMHAHLRFFMEQPVNIYLSPPPFDHAKLMTLDGEWCLVGSSNWDARSLRLNFEFDLECYDATLTAEIDALIDRKIARARRLSLEALAEAPWWRQLRDAVSRLLLPYL